MFCFSASSALAQEDKDSTKNPLSFGGYVESYYSYDFNKPATHQKSGLVYSHNRSNEVAVNLAMVKASYDGDWLRGQVGLAAGSYMNANYAAEEGVYKNIYEANIGVKLSKSHNIWFDAGIMPSHIGPESAIGIDNISLTRSIAAENSPYFETGAKLSYTNAKGDWYVAVLALNGWQKIQLPESSKGMSFGHQLTYQPNENLLFNSSSYIGNEGPDSLRFFHDFYMQVQVHEQVKLLALFDYGMQKQAHSSNTLNWWTTGLQLQYAISDRYRLNARGEYYNDGDAAMFGSMNPLPKKVIGGSLGFDMQIQPDLFWRSEFRYLSSDGAIFQKGTANYTDRQACFTTSIGWRF